MHSASLITIEVIPDYFVFYALLKFEKPEFLKKNRFFFVNVLLGIINLMFIAVSILLFIFGKSKLDPECLQCRVADDVSRRVLEFYGTVLGCISFILCIILIYRVIKYYRNEGDDTFIKDFIYDSGNIGSFCRKIIYLYRSRETAFKDIMI